MARILLTRSHETPSTISQMLAPNPVLTYTGGVARTRGVCPLLSMSQVIVPHRSPSTLQQSWSVSRALGTHVVLPLQVMVVDAARPRNGACLRSVPAPWVEILPAPPPVTLPHPPQPSSPSPSCSSPSESPPYFSPFDESSSITPPHRSLQAAVPAVVVQQHPQPHRRRAVQGVCFRPVGFGLCLLPPRSRETPRNHWCGGCALHSCRVVVPFNQPPSDHCMRDRCTSAATPWL